MYVVEKDSRIIVVDKWREIVDERDRWCNIVSVVNILREL